MLKYLKQLREIKYVQWLELNLFSWLAWFIIQTIGRTLKIKRINFDIVKEVKRKNKNIIYTFFHGEQFVLIFLHRHSELVIMTSLSRDGELQTRILKKFGYDLVRGSTKKGYTSGTISLVDKLLSGQDCAFAVDGPKGPAFKVKPGAVFVAQRVNGVIIPVRVVVKHKIQLNNWDRYILPLPFSKVYVLYGPPMEIKPQDSLKEKCHQLEIQLNSIVTSSVFLKKENF